MFFRTAFQDSLLRPKSIWENALITAALMTVTTGIAFLYWFAAENSANTALFYAAALVLVARYTTGYLPGILASLISVGCVNYFFTAPAFALDFTPSGYPVTFLAMLAISVAITTITTHFKEQALALAEHEKLLADAEKEKMKANLLRAISHDLRTPLTGIIGSSSSYLENGTHLSAEEKDALIRNISEDAQWLLHMVENLLSVTRIQNETSTVICTPEPVEEVVAEAVSRLRKRYPDASIQVRVPDEFLMIPMDAVLIEQVIINLLENAVIHSHSTRPIRLDVTDNSRFVVFSVRDYGKGIEKDRLHTVFDAAPSSSSIDGRKGMGIGLSICKTIVLAHRGQIHACNQEEGAEFSFCLPKKEDIHATETDHSDY